MDEAKKPLNEVLEEGIRHLVSRATTASPKIAGDEAMKFTQAVQNLANAKVSLAHSERLASNG